MLKPEGFQVGVNLGGWISQYRVYDHHHFKTFITEKDIQLIASWGMDHIRLPVDYPILEDDENPYEYKESGFAYIDQCLDWCKKYGLNVVLDLHRAPGYSFDTTGANSLFHNSTSQDRLISLWEAMARYYAGRKKPVIIFELLNEIAIQESDPWNKLAHRIYDRIRKIDSKHWIMMGGNEWNAVGKLKEIELFDDPKVIYTFHYYDPLPFTHQKAPWVEGLHSFNKTLGYPGEIPGLKEFLDQNPSYQNRLGRFVNARMDKQFIRSAFQQALDFINQTGRPLYCGEYGVIDIAPTGDSLNWHKDMVDLLNEFKIGRAIWTYKQMDFGLVNQEGHIINQELVKIAGAK